jgi:uncharacterized damage-inducible protein DinB
MARTVYMCYLLSMRYNQSIWNEHSLVLKRIHRVLTKIFLAMMVNTARFHALAATLVHVQGI